MSTTKLNYQRLVAVEATSRAIQHLSNGNDNVAEMTLREAKVRFADAGGIYDNLTEGFVVNGRTMFGQKFRAHVTRFTTNCTCVLVQPDKERGEAVISAAVVVDAYSGQLYEVRSRIIMTTINL